MNAASKATVFISYTARDKAWAEALAAHLQEEGIKSWIPDHSAIARGSVISEFRRGLRESEYLVVILGTEALRSSPWVHFEWGAAIGTEKRVFVVSPRGSNVDPGELPIYARAVTFHRKGGPAQVAREIKQKIDQVLAQRQISHSPSGKL